MCDSFFKEMEKRALFGTLAYGGIESYFAGSRVKEQHDKMKLTPPTPHGQDSQFKLKSPNQHQFEGGKYTNLKETTSPHVSFYK